jgi:hypothetical protein
MAGKKKAFIVSSCLKVNRTPHCAAVSLYEAYYSLGRVHEAVRSTPAMGLGIAERVWSIGDLLDAALATHRSSP